MAQSTVPWSCDTSIPWAWASAASGMILLSDELRVGLHDRHRQLAGQQTEGRVVESQRALAEDRHRGLIEIAAIDPFTDERIVRHVALLSFGAMVRCAGLQHLYTPPYLWWKVT